MLAGTSGQRHDLGPPEEGIGKRLDLVQGCALTRPCRERAHDMATVKGRGLRGEAARRQQLRHDLLKAFHPPHPAVQQTLDRIVVKPEIGRPATPRGRERLRRHLVVLARSPVPNPQRAHRSPLVAARTHRSRPA